ncbi:hypothetical protein SLE2022_298930 [Rubroshorea leprosula]
MGGCATKPKVLKGEEGKAPVSAPAPAKEAELVTPAAVTESREVVVVAGGGDAVVKVEEEIVEVDDEQGGKRQSLSNLFKEKEGEELTESDKTPLEPVKQTETEKEQSEPVKPKEPAEEEKQNEFKQGQEAEKPSVPIEPTVIPDSVVTVENIETKTPVEDAPAPAPVPVPSPAPEPASAPETETEKQVEEAK